MKLTSVDIKMVQKGNTGANSFLLMCLLVLYNVGKGDPNPTLTKLTVVDI